MSLPPFVRSVHLSGRGGLLQREVVLPSGGASVVINLAGDRFTTYGPRTGEATQRTHGAVLQGPRTIAATIDAEMQASLLTVTFEPGGAWAYFNWLPDTVNALVELDEMWGRDGATLRDQVLSARAEDRVQVVTEVLRRRFRSNATPDHQLRVAVASLSAGSSVAEAANDAGLSTRSLERRFLAKVGLTPKQYSRVRRMQRLVHSIPRLEPVGWADAAARAGFYDQAHLIDEFQAIVGMTPSQYLRNSSAFPNHASVSHFANPRTASNSYCEGMAPRRKR